MPAGAAKPRRGRGFQPFLSAARSSQPKLLVVVVVAGIANEVGDVAVVLVLVFFQERIVVIAGILDIDVHIHVVVEGGGLGRGGLFLVGLFQADQFGVLGLDLGILFLRLGRGLGRGTAGGACSGTSALYPAPENS